MTMVIQLSGERAVARLAAFRLEDGLAIAEAEDGGLWLRVNRPKKELMARLVALPHLGVFRVNERNQLMEKGKRVPSAVLPGGLEWVSLRTWLRPALPAFRLPGLLEGGQLAFRLRRCDRGFRGANALVTAWGRWADYVETASERRLRPLRFALASDGRALVLGSPLPSLRARLFHGEGGILFPLGKEPEWPPRHPDGLRRLLGLAQGDWALLDDDGTFERLRQDDLVPATRGAVRLTAERFEKALATRSEVER